jgi:spermidine/putrescine transport system permease protein
LASRQCGDYQLKTSGDEPAILTQKKKRRGFRAIHLTILPIYLTTLLFVVGPLVYMLILSFLSRSETWGVVNEFTLKSYRDIFQPVYLQTFGESIKLALLCTVLIVLIGYPFGYFMARMAEKWRTLISFFLIVPFWTSSLMRLYGWIIIFRANGILDSILMGMGITTEPLKLLYTYPAVVVGMVYVLVPFMIYSVYSSAEKLDWSLVEASRDLGATSVQAFFTVSLKLTLPGLLSGVILTFIPSMGLFFIADILGGNKVVLVGSIIQEQLMKVRNWPFAAALAVVLMLLTTLFMFLYRKVTHVKDLEGLM